MSEIKNKKNFLDLGCGTRPKEGCIGIDRQCLQGVGIVADIDYSLPLKDDSVEGICSNYFMEHSADITFLFKEIYRVCKNGATVELTVPYYASINAFKDPTHKTFFTEDTFRYFSKDQWYGSDYKIGVDFQLIKIKYHYSKIALILFPLRKYLRRHFLNMAGAMTVTLKAVK